MKSIILCLLFVALTLPGIFLLSSEASATNDKQREQPNLVIDISAALINAAVQRSIDRTEPAEETILDTPVQANGRTQGTVWAELVPSPRCAAVDVVFQGCVWARGIGFRPHVLVYTSSVTPLQVRQRVVVSAEGLRTVKGPSCSKSTITSLNVCSRQEPDAFAVRFARNAVTANLGLMESETASKTAKQTYDRMTEDLSPALVSVSQSVSRGMKEIKQAGMTVQSLDFSTTPTVLQARMSIAAPGRSQPVPPPAMTEGSDLGIAIHESLINEAAQAIQGGNTIALDQITKFYDSVTLGLLLDTRKESVQKDSLKHLEKLIAALSEKTTITLAQRDPIKVAFSDDGFSIEIRIAAIRQGNSVYKGKSLHALYRFESSPEGVHLVRQGPVKQVLVDKKAKGPSAAFLLVEELLFTEIIKERLLLAPLPLPESVSNLKFQAPRASARNGWLALAWKLGKQKQ